MCGWKRHCRIGNPAEMAAKRKNEKWPQKSTKCTKGKPGRTTVSFDTMKRLKLYPAELFKLSRSFFAHFVLFCGHSSLFSSCRGLKTQFSNSRKMRSNCSAIRQNTSRSAGSK